MAKLELVGNANAILTNVERITTENNDPQLKITPVGFLQMLLENNATAEITNLPDLRRGQSRTVKVRYQQRGLESSVATTDTCAADIEPEWKETAIGNLLYRKIGIKLTDEDLRALTADAADTKMYGMTKALVETIYTKINALIQAIDTALVSAQASAFGKNIAYAGTAAGAVQSIALSETTKMNNGIVRLRTDMAENEVYGDLLVVGNGRIAAYDAYHRYKNGIDAAGFGKLPMNVYEDFKTKTAWGANYFGVFEKNTVGLVEWDKFVGPYSGKKGTSEFFTLPMPLRLSNGEIITMTFDAQLKYNDCPVTADGTTEDRGWHLYLSKNFVLFNLPSDAYASGDRLNGVNGTFLYQATEAAPETIAVTPATGAEFAVTPTEDAVFKTQEVTPSEE